MTRLSAGLFLVLPCRHDQLSRSGAGTDFAAAEKADMSAATGPPALRRFPASHPTSTKVGANNSLNGFKVVVCDQFWGTGRPAKKGQGSGDAASKLEALLDTAAVRRCC